MAYTTIDDPTSFFNTVLYTGDGNNGKTVTGVGFQPDWVWLKSRSEAEHHTLNDNVRGANKQLYSHLTYSEATDTDRLQSFDSDGFTLGTDDIVNKNTETFVSWNWKAGGTAPNITYTVKVVSDSGNKYRFDDFGTSAVTLDLQEGGTYTFDQSDSSNATHPLRFYTASDKSGGEYTTGVTTSGTAGSSGAKTVITVAASAPTLYYQCSSHAGMGGQANTNSTFGSSNFSGSIQSTVSAGSTQGFSIVSYTGTGSNATVGHGLGAVPKMIFFKDRETSVDWGVYAEPNGNTKEMYLSTTDAAGTNSGAFNSTTPTSSVFTIGTSSRYNPSSKGVIAYCFADVKGYTKIGSYTGNGNASNNAYVYTGFRPAFVFVKRTNGTGNWWLADNKRNDAVGGNDIQRVLFPNLNNAEATDSAGYYDFFSNGFRVKSSSVELGGSGDTYIYMAFAESPFVNSKGIPTNAR